MNYRALAQLATRAADKEDLIEIVNALSSLQSEKAYKLKNRLSKHADKIEVSSYEIKHLKAVIELLNI